MATIDDIISNLRATAELAEHQPEDEAPTYIHEDSAKRIVVEQLTALRTALDKQGLLPGSPDPFGGHPDDGSIEQNHAVSSTDEASRLIFAKLRIAHPAYRAHRTGVIAFGITRSTDSTKVLVAGYARCPEAKLEHLRQVGAIDVRKARRQSVNDLIWLAVGTVQYSAE